jgi:hypothetical protein
MVRDAIKDYVFAGASGEIVDGLKSLVGEPVKFERGMEGNNGVVSERGRHTIAIQGSCGEGSGVDSVGYLLHSALFLETLEQIQEGAISLILLIELTRLVERKEGRGLGKLGKGQAHLKFSHNTYLAYYKWLFMSMYEN